MLRNENNESTTSSEKTSAAKKLQKSVRGYLARQKIKVKTIDKGIVHIQIKGNAAFLNQLGISDIDPNRDSRRINILSLSQKDFNGKVVGGHQLSNVVNTSSTAADLFGSGNSIAYINGGFFNAGTFFKEHSEHTTIGPIKTETVTPDQYISIPEEYRNDYATLTLNETQVSLAPQLSQSGEPCFDGEKFKTSNYQYDTIRNTNKPCPPGALFHASDPNPRAGISIPSSTNLDTESKNSPNQNRIRLAVATASSRGPNSNGFTMFEWGKTMLRLSQLDPVKGDAYNLDGGGSVVMGVMNKGEKIVEIAQEKNGRNSSTFISFTSK